MTDTGFGRELAEALRAGQADDLAELVAAVDALRTEQAELRATVTGMWEQIQPLLGEVVPMIQKLEDSAMFKMITAGGKRRG